VLFIGQRSPANSCLLVKDHLMMLSFICSYGNKNYINDDDVFYLFLQK